MRRRTRTRRARSTATPRRASFPIRKYAFQSVMGILLEYTVIGRRAEEHIQGNTTTKVKELIVPHSLLLPLAFVLQSNNSCCPDCKKCEPHEWITGGHCMACPPGKMPYENRTRCYDLDEQIIDYRNPWAAGAMAFALFGKQSFNSFFS